MHVLSFFFFPTLCHHRIGGRNKKKIGLLYFFLTFDPIGVIL